MKKNISPYNNDLPKKEQIRLMFNGISNEYDALNRIISFGLDVKWRKNIIRKIARLKPKIILDVATGTGDLAIELTKINPSKIIGLDLSEEMISIGRKKILKLKLNKLIDMIQGDCEEMIFKNNYFDVVTVGFGVRNFENLDKGLAEIYRVLKVGGKIVVLETSNPKSKILFYFYRIYSEIIPPFIGWIFSKDKYAYKYLKNSASVFPYGKDFNNILAKNGFIDITDEPQTLGVTSIYFASKP